MRYVIAGGIVPSLFLEPSVFPDGRGEAFGDTIVYQWQLSLLTKPAFVVPVSYSEWNYRDVIVRLD